MKINDYNRDFYGFYFNGKSSLDFNIFVASGGSRFEKSLLPPAEDTTLKIGGRDGDVFFQSYYRPQTFAFNIAYDNLSEKDITDLQYWLGYRDVADFSTITEPYKIYRCRVGSQPKLSFVPFIHNEQRVYKGEGTIQFQAYEPFAKARYRDLDDYPIQPGGDERYGNKDLWAAASGILSSRSAYNVDVLPNDAATTSMINLHNPGQAASPLILGFTLPPGIYSDFIKISYFIHSVFQTTLLINLSGLGDSGGTFILDGEKHTLTQTGTTGRPNHNAALLGDFFEIQPVPTGDFHYLRIEKPSGVSITQIAYDYLYY